jgi:hypothetical protein
VTVRCDSTARACLTTGAPGVTGGGSVAVTAAWPLLGACTSSPE